MGSSGSKAAAANVPKDGNGRSMRQYDVSLTDTMSMEPRVSMKLSFGKAKTQKNIRFLQPTAAAADPNVINAMENAPPVSAPAGGATADAGIAGDAGTSITDKDGKTYIYVKTSATVVEFKDPQTSILLAVFDREGGAASGQGRLWTSEDLVGTGFFDLVGTLIATWLAKSANDASNRPAAAESTQPQDVANAGEGETAQQQQQQGPVPTVSIVQTN